MNPATRILVVGASVASGALLSQLREEGFSGAVTVVDADPDAPYDRPPLSKDFLTGSALRPEAPWWDDCCRIVRGRATALDVADGTVAVTHLDGTTSTLGGDHVVIATGATPVQLPGQPPGVHRLRTAADARALRAAAIPGRRIIILGAGTIGTELASSLVDAGCDVAVVDLADRPLDRFLAGHLGDEAAGWMRDAGVTLHLGTRVHDVDAHAGGWVVRTDAGTLAADDVVSAVGTRPATRWLAGSGLDLSDGVRCDANGTALDAAGRPVPHVHAIGDASAWNASDGGGFSRREDWTTAQRQGRHLAHHLLGHGPVPAAGREYLWTHQFGCRIQVLGVPERDAALVQHLADPIRNAASYTVERGSRILAWITINSPREFARAMRESMVVAR